MISALFLERYTPTPFLASPLVGWNKDAVAGARAAILDYGLGSLMLKTAGPGERKMAGERGGLPPPS